MMGSMAWMCPLELVNLILVPWPKFSREIRSKFVGSLDIITFGVLLSVFRVTNTGLSYLTKDEVGGMVDLCRREKLSVTMIVNGPSKNNCLYDKIIWKF
ncbi:hypothetical protein BpHYR1_020609 [Brachionus plicatilis]|uniref:Uncharacterized protein n=1 Tax=Brachionus plicatilis TaxID=10195 RepID=A0A3M7PQC6_BRAPC|nr:hypothetical protein BpHYR1_020609 [Brachionus plicatilis]